MQVLALTDMNQVAGGGDVGVLGGALAAAIHEGGLAVGGAIAAVGAAFYAGYAVGSLLANGQSPSGYTMYNAMGDFF